MDIEKPKKTKSLKRSVKTKLLIYKIQILDQTLKCKPNLSQRPSYPSLKITPPNLQNITKICCFSRWLY